MTILVVDDNQDAAESMRLLLRQVGAEVCVAHDGPQALEAFDACRPRYGAARTLQSLITTIQAAGFDQRA